MTEFDHHLRVSLYSARIPWIGWLAEHCWFVIDSGGQCDRWEVWQRANDGGDSWGHLHRNLLNPTQGVGNGPATLVQQWTDTSAERFASRLQRAPESYPWCNHYWLWPGPNSNTFAQWILQREFKLGYKALGKSFWRLAPADIREPP